LPFCAAVLFWLLPDAEKEIRNKLQQLISVCSSSKDESCLATISNADKITNLSTVPRYTNIELFAIKRDFIKNEK
jgi:hypothetical protein